MAQNKQPRTQQEAIVFQNQSHLIQKHFSECGYCPTLLEIALATDLMVDFALNGYSSELKKRFDNMETHMKSSYLSVQEQVK